MVSKRRNLVHVPMVQLQALTQEAQLVPIPNSGEGRVALKKEKIFFSNDDGGTMLALLSSIPSWWNKKLLH